MDEPTHEERREHPRLNVDLPARIQRDGEAQVTGRAVDLSEGGIRIAGEHLPTDSEVTVEIELADLGWQRLTAEVVRGEPGEGEMAARFAAAAASGGRQALKDFIERYIGSSARLP